MSDVNVNASQARPMSGALTRQLKAGEASAVGRLIYIDAGGDAKQADAGAEATVTGQLGIVVAGARNDPGGDIVSGEQITVALSGPVFLGEDAGLDESKLYYASANAGRIADAKAGTGAYDRPVGYPISATVLNFAPGAELPAASS